MANINLVTRADGAEPCTYDLNEILQLGHERPIPCLGWDKPTESSQLLVEQTGGVRPDRAACQMVAMSLFTGHPVCLVGPQGCGKSALLKVVLGITNWDVVITQASGSAELLDLMGVRMPDGSWIEQGPLSAFREGKVWMVEERDCFSPGTSTDLNTLLDRAPLRVPYLGHDAIPSPNFRVVGTANTIGNGEGIESFLSSQIQTPAANRRWIFHKMGYVPAKEEENLLLHRCPSLREMPHVARVLLDFASLTRGQRDFPAFSTAELCTTADLLQIGSVRLLPQLLESTYFSKLTSTQEAAAKEMWSTSGGQAMASILATP
ncbi:ATP-binding cassette domain-containing protein [Sinimarinibacterium sp. CAU 1509]|uniref:AAA family ATPase n=1 Tax=Sinimarinibacterium sp. CAU 1509 TaxID=2562283 RepID=UPI0010ABCA04|nr:AAA family ATPase [Sinimarinibacterium sp. CAU 1509]TJY57278.1 ATP-binding cassette domain-containing protein [Sinimarinibacterium sp. CAU 1509]